MEQNILNSILDKFGDGDQERSDIRHNDSGDENDNHSDHEGNRGNNECCEGNEDGGDKEYEVDVEDMTDEQYAQFIQEQQEPKIKSGGNTGVKGVLSDYAEHREKQKQKYLQKKYETQKMLEKMCFTTRDQPPTTTEEENQLDSDDDDLERIRKARMEQWKSKQQITSDVKKPEKKVFGYFKQIDSSQYIHEIDNEPPNVFVIIHLFQNYIPECVLLNQQLGQLAVKYRYIKFLKILSKEAKVNYHDEALPSLLVYIGGKLLVSFVPITEELGRNFDQEDLELLLSSYDIIPNPMKAKNSNWETSLSRKRPESDDDNDD
ncbi:hypothetical protein ACTFIZ_005510 [Dictyostelium cf. discoideum]